MYRDFLLEMDDAQQELTSAISMISVIADGISTFRTNNALTGKSADIYADALLSTYNALSRANQKIQEMISREIDSVGQEAIA